MIAKRADHNSKKYRNASRPILDTQKYTPILERTRRNVEKRKVKKTLSSLFLQSLWTRFSPVIIPYLCRGAGDIDDTAEASIAIPGVGGAGEGESSHSTRRTKTARSNIEGFK
jgi:hypothetical protein